MPSCTTLAFLKTTDRRCPRYDAMPHLSSGGNTTQSPSSRVATAAITGELGAELFALWLVILVGRAVRIMN